MVLPIGDGEGVQRQQGGITKNQTENEPFFFGFETQKPMRR